MNKKTKLLSAHADLKHLPITEQQQIKGGLLIYCEEKRSSFMGRTYTTTQWKIKPNGSLFISIRM